MQERLKIIREYFGMTQSEFAKKLGIGQSTLAMMEVSKRDISDRHIKTICAICNVNEIWLRTGEGEMFDESDEFSLDEYAKQNKLTALEFDILKTYMELDSDVRKNLMSNLKTIFNKHDKAEITHITSSNDPTIEELEEEYKKRHSKSVSKTEVSASNGIGGDKNKVI